MFSFVSNDKWYVKYRVDGPEHRPLSLEVVDSRTVTASGDSDGPLCGEIRPAGGISLSVEVDGYDMEPRMS